MSGHFLKLYLFIFENSQEKHNSLDCQYVFWNRLHYLQSLNAQNLMQIKILFTCLSTQISRVDSPFFSNILFPY